MTTTSGLLLVDKPQGLTSHDVVARVRKILDERRVGHAGTLDPMATGLLVVAVGPSTRLLRFAQGELKRYRGTVRFGVATDSLDADGQVVEERPFTSLSDADAREIASSMLGTQFQTPPMVSALKVGGRRLHSLAREGLEVDRAAREITISDFTVAATDDPAVWSFDVECTSGTYVRVLMSDFAQRAATVGHLTSLRRTRSGNHDVGDATSLDALATMVDQGVDPLRAPLDFVEGLGRTTLDEAQEHRVRMGQLIEVVELFADAEIAATNERGSLVAILRRRGEQWKPEVVLPDETGPAQG